MAATSTGSVAGVTAGSSVRPTSVPELAELVRDCAAAGQALVASGTGTKLGWGAAPARLDVLVDTTGLAGVVEHVAGDLVVTVRAGTPLDDLAAALAGAGQRLAADPVVGPGHAGHGTVGGLVATAASGPLRLSAGAVRDLLIGLTFVRADGEVAHAGGKVVKNVAGYDLCKLLTGSWGTLGVLVQATFRLHPLPAAARWVTAAVDDAGAASAAAGLARSQTAPGAVEVDLAGGSGTVAVLLEGTPAGVESRCGPVDALCGGASVVDEVAPAWWGRAPWPEAGTGLRCTAVLSRLPQLLDALRSTGLPWRVRGSAAVGVVHAGLAPTADPAAVAAAVGELRARSAGWSGDVVVLDAPAAVRALVDPWGPVRGLELMRRVKERFDPGGVLAPGRFVGGI